MTTTYMECPRCGKRALSVATRCPQCGLDFPPRPLHRPVERPSSGRWVPGIVAGVVGAAVVLAAVFLRRPSGAPEPTAPAASAPDRVTAAEPAASVATPPAPSADTVISSRTPTPASALTPAPAASGPTTRRYARTWANVRGARGRSAPRVGTLNPGDPVLVDSLVRGWYRVLVEGRTLGYVHRSTLGAVPPE